MFVVVGCFFLICLKKQVGSPYVRCVNCKATGSVNCRAIIQSLSSLLFDSDSMAGAGAISSAGTWEMNPIRNPQTHTGQAAKKFLIMATAAPGRRRKSLRSHWEQACRTLQVPKDVQSRWFERIRVRYEEKHRAYHTLEHLTEMFGYFSEHEAKLANPELVAMAIFFHDIVYDPRAAPPANENDSAREFERFALEVQSASARHLLDSRSVVQVSQWISQTATHACDPKDSSDCRLFMDMDMAILGQSRRRYRRYTAQVQHEFSHIPVALYAAARSTFLVQLATQASIFATDAFRRKYEAQARSNIAFEIKQLRDGVNPVLFWAARALIALSHVGTLGVIIITVLLVGTLLALSQRWGLSTQNLYKK